MSAPVPAKTLFIYLTATDVTVSAVLLREDFGVQKPVYYVSKALQGPELRHSPIEKLALAQAHTSRRLRPYFQAHTIVVLTNHLLKEGLYKPEVSGRLTKWAIELGQYDIQFQPRTAMKGQVLADFIAETPLLEE